MAFAPPHAHLQRPIPSLPAGPQGFHINSATIPCRLAMRRIAPAAGDNIFDVIPPTGSAVTFFANEYTTGTQHLPWAPSAPWILTGIRPAGWNDALAQRRINKYRFDDIPMGHTVGLNLVGLRKTNMSWVVVACYAPDQIAMFSSSEEAAAHVFAFAPPVGFCNILGLGCPQWVFHLGTQTLAKVVQLGDLVYTDRDGFYAGGAIIDEVSPPNNPLPGYRHLVVKGSWVDRGTDADGAHFCVLVPTHFYLPVPRANYRAQWVISEYDHCDVDPRFQETWAKTNILIHRA